MCLLTGINMVKRKLAAHDNLKITIEQNGDKFHVKEVSNFRTLDIDFTLGVTFEYSLADGTLLSVSKHGLKWVIFFPSATPSNDSKIGPVISDVCKMDQVFQSLKILAISAARKSVTCLNSQLTTEHDIHETANPCTFAELSLPLHLMVVSCTTFAGRVEPGRRHVEGDFHKEGQREATNNNQNCSGG